MEQRQTDFTNYAARRLAERRLLREEDPIKLQHVVTEIAYARGSSSATRYVPSDSPLGPLRPPPEAMGWPDSTLREQYDDRARTADGSTLRQQIAINEAEIRARQTRQRAVSGQPAANDHSDRAAVGEAEAENRIGKGRAQVAQDAATLSEDDTGSVPAGKVSPDHGRDRRSLTNRPGQHPRKALNDSAVRSLNAPTARLPRPLRVR